MQPASRDCAMTSVPSGVCLGRSSSWTRWPPPVLAAVRVADHGAGAIVDPGLFIHRKRSRSPGRPPATVGDEAPDALVAGGETAGVHQILPDRHGVWPRESPSSIASRYGQGALAEGLRPGGGSGTTVAPAATPRQSR
jgi:hypothetical protein